MLEKYIGIIEICDCVFTIIQKDVDDFYTTDKINKVLIAGTTCNNGLMPLYEEIIDEDFTLDENLQSFIEEIEDKERNGNWN